MEQLHKEVDDFETLIIIINKTNIATLLDNGMSMMEALARRDMLRYKQYVYNNLADIAAPSTDRYSRREIKFISAINISEARKKSDEIARECRLLDMKIQQANWITALL